jgi:hypothetical protein
MEPTMTTKRIPIARPRRAQITPLAIRLFTEMAAISCTCAPCDGGDEHWERHEECAGCKTWRKLHGLLHQELGCRPWEWPCIRPPETECTYPPDSPADQTWRPEEQAQRLWRILEQAAHEARRMEVAEAKEGGTQSGATQSGATQ